jgi:mannose-6-phosphate isomerase
MTELEPFRLEPVLKERVWGGTRLGEHAPPYGEAWIACDESPIITGSLAGQTLAEAVAAHPIDLLGEPVYETEGAVFPLLIKLLDPVDWLSIQVHPDDALAVELEGAGFRGKTEAWYVLEAEPGAELIAGVVPGVDSANVAAAVRNGTLEALLERHPVRAGDALLVEAGLIHALGPGIFIYEVQQSSDLTYRVSDWGRPAGAGRQLHLEQSVRAAKPAIRPQFAPMVRRLPNGSFPVLSCRYFVLELVDSDGLTIERNTGQGSFEAVTAIEGSFELVAGGNRLRLERFDSAIVPASAGRYQFAGDAPFRALVSTVP